MGTIGSMGAEKMEIFSSSDRVGKFKILHKSLGDPADQPLLQALMGLCIVLHVEEHESGRGKQYYASSVLFQPLLEGEEIPEYRIDFAFDSAFPNPEHEAKRINNGAFGFVAIRQHIVRVPAAALAHAVKVPGPIH
jgi:hypothetical protein